MSTSHRLPMAALLGLSLTLAACSGPAVPDEPPALSEAPMVASDGFLTAYVEETIPLELEELRAFMDENPLITFLQPTENISNPVASQVVEGEWPQPGAVRWLRLADGHYVIERVLDNTPDFFKYQVFVFTNATGRGVEQIVGEQRFIKTDNGTRFEWTYNVKPTNAVTRFFVSRNMPEVEAYIGGGLRGLVRAASGSQR